MKTIPTYRGHLIVALCTIGLALPSLFATSVLTFPTSEGTGGYLRENAADTQNFNIVNPGETLVAWNAVFGATIPRNPNTAYPGVPWTTPEFYGGYRLVTTNNSNGPFLPNFVRTVISPATGSGYASLPVTKIFAMGQTGTVTNTVTGAFVTPTAITDGGVFTIELTGAPLDGATATFRGVAFDGTHWLVTADAATIPPAGATSATVSTANGWRELDVSNFSVLTTPMTVNGSITYSGIWFEASETNSPSSSTFSFTFSNVSYTANDSSSAALAASAIIATAIGLASSLPLIP